MTSPHKILLVDDASEFRALVGAPIREHGFHVVEAGTADEALRAFDAAGPFDLCIIDGLLPDASGLDVIAQLRSRGFTGKLIFVSPFLRNFREYSGLLDRCDVARILAKPIAPSELLVHIQEELLRPAPIGTLELAGPRDLDEPARRANVLVLHDDQSMSRELADLVAERGHRVRTTASHENLVASVEAYRPDVIVLPVSEANGFELCGLIRDLPRGRGAVVIVVLDSPDLEQRIGCFEAGADDSDQMPLAAPELFARIEAGLRRFETVRNERTNREE